MKLPKNGQEILFMAIDNFTGQDLEKRGIVLDDAAAYIKSIANKRKRNAEWAEKAVRESLSITGNDALKMNVIDFASTDLKSLLSSIDKKEVVTSIGKYTIKTSGVNIKYIEMSVRHKILDIISDPNIAYLLMLLGFYGIFFELTNPGAIFPGVIGALSLILALYSFQTLPVNYAGVMLIFLGDAAEKFFLQLPG